MNSIHGRYGLTNPETSSGQALMSFRSQDFLFLQVIMLRKSGLSIC